MLGASSPSPSSRRKISRNDGGGSGGDSAGEIRLTRWSDATRFRCIPAPGWYRGGGGRAEGIASRPPYQRDLEGIRNRGSVPRRGPTQSQNTNGLHTPGCPTYSPLHTTPPNPLARPSRPMNLDQSPMLESPESEASFVIHAFLYKYRRVPSVACY